MTYQMIQVGTGGRGARWCGSILQPAIEAGHIEPVAAVDVDPDAHANAQEDLGLDPARCYTDAADAFATHDADFCAVVVPPWAHEEIVNAALAHGLDVLSEKPIADTLEASVRIAEKVERAGAKMGVTMSHRFDRDKTSLRREIRRDRNGPLDYIVGRFTCDRREYGDWGASFRHEMEDPLLVEGGVHQLDFLADMAGERVDTLTPTRGVRRGQSTKATVRFCSSSGWRTGPGSPGRARRPTPSVSTAGGRTTSARSVGTPR